MARARHRQQLAQEPIRTHEFLTRNLFGCSPIELKRGGVRYNAYLLEGESLQVGRTSRRERAMLDQVAEALDVASDARPGFEIGETAPHVVIDEEAVRAKILLQNDGLAYAKQCADEQATQEEAHTPDAPVYSPTFSPMTPQSPVKEGAADLGN